MFTAARRHLEEARKFIATARALVGFSRTAKDEYLKKAEVQLVMAELYIK